MILEHGKDTRELFRIEWDGETYYAVRFSKPSFVMAGKTIVEAAGKAERALALCSRLIDKKNFKGPSTKSP